MPQYSDTQRTNSGIVVTAVYNSETRQISYTVTAPNGATANSTLSSDASGNSTSNIKDLFNQLLAGGYEGGPAQMATALASVQNNVLADAKTAEAQANAENSPPPAQPEPTPINPATDPGVPQPTAAPTQQEQLANLRAAQTAANGGVDPSPSDPALAEQLARIDANREQVNYTTPPTPTGTLPVFTQDQINRSTEVTNANPETVTDADAAVKALDEQSRLEAEQRLNETYANDAANNTAGSVDQVRSTGVSQTQRNARQQEDWRVRLQLAPQSNYLYNDPSVKQGDLLYPLKASGGVIFPYTPQISTSYKANYDPSDIAHTNYKQYFYKNSSVDDVQIVADFTAQDTVEALYVLGVIHFFKSVTKMFYGLDSNPRAGTPPPLCYLFGYGQYQFSDHPLLITSFQYSLPNDVDYIRAGSTTQWAGQNVAPYSPKAGGSSMSISRLFNSGLTVGGMSPEPKFAGLSNSQATYVPTKIQITLNAIPIVTRGNIANNFSVKQYATGELLKKGIW